MTYIGKIRFGRREHGKEYELESNWLNFVNKLIDIEKVKSYIRKIIDIESLNNMMDELKTYFGTYYILTERLPEYAHPLGEKVEIDLSENFEVIDIHAQNGDKKFFDDWYIFSKGLQIPDKLKIEIQLLKNHYVKIGEIEYTKVGEIVSKGALGVPKEEFYFVKDKKDNFYLKGKNEIGTSNEKYTTFRLEKVKNYEWKLEGKRAPESLEQDLNKAYKNHLNG